MDTIIKLKGISKMFGGNYVLKDISLEIERGEIHSIIGENGAGKTTLMKIIGGIFSPYSGRMWKNGKEVIIQNAMQAYEHGIGIVHQELSIAENLTVAENIFAGRQPINKLGFIQEEKMNKQATEILQKIGVNLDPRELLGNLSIAMQQIVEIAKVISHEIDVMILDEPTSSLSRKEINNLFNLIKRMSETNNITVLFISHKLDEVIELSHRVSVLRNGKLIGTLTKYELTIDKMIRMMVGNSLDTRDFIPPSTPEGDVILQVNNIGDDIHFRNVTFEVKKNRILGMFGLVGAGRTETVLSIIGAKKFYNGNILYKGKEIRHRSPKHSINNRIIYLTENRRDLGLFLTKYLPDNITASSLKDFTNKFRNINKKKVNVTADDYIRRLNIQPPDKKKIAVTFSGGNQQKILLSKSLLTQPEILIVDEPTRGVDVRVKMTIHQMLRDLADSGLAIIMISSELPEILKLSDEIAVMHEGDFKGVINNEAIFEHDIMTLVYS